MFLRINSSNLVEPNLNMLESTMSASHRRVAFICLDILITNINFVFPNVRNIHNDCSKVLNICILKQHTTILSVKRHGTVAPHGEWQWNIPNRYMIPQDNKHKWQMFCCCQNKFHRLGLDQLSTWLYDVIVQGRVWLELMMNLAYCYLTRAGSHTKPGAIVSLQYKSAPNSCTLLQTHRITCLNYVACT